LPQGDKTRFLLLLTDISTCISDKQRNISLQSKCPYKPRLLHPMNFDVVITFQAMTKVLPRPALCLVATEITHVDSLPVTGRAIRAE